MPAVKEPIAERLTFDWCPSARPEHAWEVLVTEHRPRKPRATLYRVDEVTPPGPRAGYRSFLFAKAEDHDGDRADDVYEAVIGADGGWCCNCKGSACRRHGLRCRHVLSVQSAIEQGVL